MSVIRIIIDSPKPAAALANRINPANGSREMITKIAELFAAAASGSETAKIRIHGSAVQASGTVTFASIVENDTVTINGVVFTGKDSPASAVQFTTGVSDENSANSLRAKVNAATSAKIYGEVYATRRGTLAGSSVIATDTAVVNGVTFTCKASPDAGIPEEFALGADDTATMANLANAISKSLHPNLSGLISAVAATGTITINYDGALTLSSSGGTITAASKIVVITAVQPGAVGNLFTLAISAHGSVSGAALTGGTDGTEYIFSNR